MTRTSEPSSGGLNWFSPSPSTGIFGLHATPKWPISRNFIHQPNASSCSPMVPITRTSVHSSAAWLRPERRPQPFHRRLGPRGYRPPSVTASGDDLVADLVATMLQDDPPPTAILGGPGHGKTTVSLKALHDPRVAERFGARRFFVRCEGAKARDALAGEIALAMGLEPGPELEERAFAELERGARGAGAGQRRDTLGEPITLATEGLLAQLAAIRGLCLVVSVRGQQRAAGSGVARAGQRFLRSTCRRHARHSWRWPASSSAPILGSMTWSTWSIASRSRSHYCPTRRKDSRISTGSGGAGKPSGRRCFSGPVVHTGSITWSSRWTSRSAGPA